MACLHMLISEVIQVLHRSVIHYVPSQDNHVAVSVIRESLELRIEFHQVHAAER